MFSPETVKIEAGEKVIIDAKIALELPPKTVALVWDKGSLACKKGLKILGGVFDEGYRGSYMIGVINLSKKGIIIKKGEKFCQLLIQPIVHVKVLEADINKQTSRGSGRMGSSGK